MARKTDEKATTENKRRLKARISKIEKNICGLITDLGINLAAQTRE